MLQYFALCICQFQSGQVLVISLMKYDFYKPNGIILSFSENDKQLLMQKVLLILLRTIQNSFACVFFCKLHK